MRTVPDRGKADRPSPIPVTVLCGALGAGKTTLLNAALRGVLTRAAVVVNEFGAVGIDHDLIEAATEDVVLLPGGCVCCQVRADLAVALLQLELGAKAGEHPDFDRVIVETSGLAEPGPILQLFAESPTLAGRFYLAALVTVVDAQFGPAALADDSQAYRQALLADRLIISKFEGVDAASLAELESRLAVINPNAEKLRAPRGAAHAAWFEAAPIAPGRIIPASAFRAVHDDAIESFTLQWEQPQSLVALGDWLHGLADRFGARLLRVKGIVSVIGQDRAVALHIVQHIVASPESVDVSAAVSRVVFITRGLEPGDVAPAWRFEVTCAADDRLAPAGPRRLPPLRATAACDEAVQP
jgi:G3E family GTPase